MLPNRTIHLGSLVLPHNDIPLIIIYSLVYVPQDQTVYIYTHLPEKVPPARMSLSNGLVHKELMQDITGKTCIFSN